jgi:hypothetical protein
MNLGKDEKLELEEEGVFIPPPPIVAVAEH